MNAQREFAAQAVVVAPASPVGEACRRAMDIVGAGVLLVLLSPVLLAAALAIRLTSRGPILFRQERVGRGERIFMVVKLRTMVVNHAKVIDIARVEALAKDGVLTKSENDPRITRVGRFLRRTSVDELPQLWNVLTGDMSLIGPRPLIPFMLAPYPELRRVRCTVRPGLTGLWQVSTRSDNTTALAMADADLEYIATRSLRGDMAILVRTVPAILKGSGAM
jgi:lipopolysaccharide/colanic/teichoic acid biosynthesis glycosyltransferase